MPAPTAVMGELGEPDAAAGSPVDQSAASKTGPSAICGNPLCRKRWKQLAELSFPVFCPACRVQAEALLPEDANADLNSRWRALLEVWNDIATEIEAFSGLAMKPWPRMFDQQMPSVADWEASFWSAFPKPPDRHVTTWNGMKKLRQMLRVRVVERRGRVLLLEPLAVLDPKTLEVTERPVEKGAQLFLVDWTQEHNSGDEVVVIAMPNPAKTERKYVPFIVKIPHATDPDEERPQSKTSGRWAPSGLTKPGPPAPAEPPAPVEKPKRSKKKKDDVPEYDAEPRPRRGSGPRGGYRQPTLEGPRLDQAQGWYSSYQYPPPGGLGALAHMQSHQQHHLAQTHQQQQHQQQQYAAALAAAQMVSPGLVTGWGVAPVAGVLPSGMYVAPDGSWPQMPQPPPPWTTPSYPTSYPPAGRDEHALAGPKATWRENRQRSGAGRHERRSPEPLTPEPAEKESVSVSPKAEGRATTPTPSLFPPTPSPAFQSALPMRMPYLNMENFGEDLPEAPKSVKAKSGRGTPSSTGRQTPGSTSGVGALKKQKSYPSYGPTPSPVYAQMQAGLLTLGGASDAPKKQGTVSNQFDSLMSWVNEDGEGAGLGQLPSWEEEQADPNDDEPQLPLSGQASPEFASAAARLEPLSAQHLDAAAAVALRAESSRSPGSSSLSPQLRPIGSPGGSPTRERASPSAPRSSSPRQSPLQTILEEWPDLNPPGVLPEPKRVVRPRPPWVKDKPAS